MRGELLQQLLKERFARLDLDDMDTESDRLRFDDEQRDEGEPAPERCGQLMQGQVSFFGTWSSRTMISVFELVVPYADGPEVGKRIIGDGERILVCIAGIGASLHPDISGPQKIGDWVPTQDQATGQISCRVSFAIAYQLTEF